MMGEGEQLPPAFNMGSGTSITIMDLARRIGERMGVPVMLEELTESHESKHVKGRVRIPYEMRGMRLDMSLASEWLVHRPVRSIDRIITDEVHWLIHGHGLDRWREAAGQSWKV
jgi:nucleoside-diphosphate-sugar epimerase